MKSLNCLKVCKCIVNYWSYWVVYCMKWSWALCFKICCLAYLAVCVSLLQLHWFKHMGCYQDPAKAYKNWGGKSMLIITSKIYKMVTLTDWNSGPQEEKWSRNLFLQEASHWIHMSGPCWCRSINLKEDFRHAIKFWVMLKLFILINFFILFN